ncbi:MAG: hypothetical protein LCH86_22005 [Proteobacteria bacterium]|jgi:hypothetical protein|uniref:hypothetical protein n=1 Tax=Hoeflea sp. 108 TaxID=1116369 RepID=UPI0003643360|nr:hypothetical protein [Hoeflea sp. 108]MCA0278677.1 hypothetical protein [Pseudomonadota bacterium]
MTWKTYLIAQALGVAAFNALCNAAYTAYLWRAEPVLPLDLIGADLAMTPIWIGLLSVLLGTPFIRKALADGRMMRDAGLRAPPLATLLPRNLVVRAIAAASLCAAMFALPLALVLPWLGDGLLTQVTAIGSKVIITIVSSLIIVPLVAYATIADMPATKVAHVSRS